MIIQYFSFEKKDIDRFNEISTKIILGFTNTNSKNIIRLNVFENHHIQFNENSNSNDDVFKYNDNFIFSVNKNKKNELFELIDHLEKAEFESYFNIINEKNNIVEKHKPKKPEIDIQFKELNDDVICQFTFNGNLLDMLYYHKVLNTAIELLNKEYKFKLQDEVIIDHGSKIKEYIIFDYVYNKYTDDTLYSIIEILSRTNNAIIYKNDLVVSEKLLKLNLKYKRNKTIEKLFY